MTATAVRSFEILADSVSELVWTLTPGGACQFCNNRWSDFTGIHPEQALGLGWRESIHRDDLKRVISQWDKGVSKGSSFDIRYRMRDSENRYHPFLVRYKPLDADCWVATACAPPVEATSDVAVAGSARYDSASAGCGRQSSRLSQVVSASSESDLSLARRPVAPVLPMSAAIGPKYCDSALPSLSVDQGRWKLALEAAGLGACELDLKTGEASRSLRHDQIFGYETLLPEWNYAFFLEHVLVEDRAHVDAAFKRALDDGCDWLFECRIHRADGELRWIRGSGRALKDQQGQPQSMWSIVEDTTERKLAEQALRDREAHFRSLADTAPAMLWVSNVDHLCTFISRGWCVFTGQSMASSLGRGWTESIHPEDRERVTREFSEAARRRQPFQIECRLKTAEGDYRWVLDAGRPRKSLNGDFMGYVGSVTDIHSTKSVREEQQRTNELLHAVIDTTQDCVYVKDIFGRMRLANPAALRAIGKPSGQVMGHSDVEWLDSIEEGVAIEANDLRVMESGRTEVVEERMTTANGSRVYVVTKSPLRDEDGKVVGLVGIGRDVTEQKRAEQQVLESESRMRRLFDNAPANIAIFEGPEHRCVYLNSSHIKFYGERRCLGLTVRDAFPEFSEDGEIRRLDQVFHSGDPLVTPHVEFNYEGAGSGLPSGIFHETIQPWFHENGRVAGVMVMAFDITQEVALRREVEESSARFRALADNIAQLAWMADERGRIFWYNRRWLDYTGTTLKDMQHSRWGNVHHPDHAQRVIRKVSHCLRTGEALEETFPLRSGDGTYRWFYSQAIPIRDDSGKVIRWFGTHTDITEQREAAQALEAADRRKDEFLAMLAHELRNPLAPVHYAVEILRNEDARYEEQAKARDMIDRQVAHMSRLIDDLLDVSRITRGTIELRKSQCDLADIVRRTVAEYRLSLQASKINLSCIAPPDPLWVDGDATRLIQAIGNLLHNAGKFTEPGGQVTVELCPAANASAAVLTVADNGVGIETSLLSQLFEPFSQASQTLDRSKGGLGLGLSLVKGLIELHGGTVAAASAGPGHGATFTLRLPLAVTAHEVAEQAPKYHRLAPELRVLIIEDNRDTAESLGTLLQLAGHRVNVAYDGPSGVELAKQIAPDVVLCDVGLPGGMDGYQVVRSLRKQPLLSNPRLFALSGYGQEADRRMAREAGFHRHFVKPVDYSELSEALANVGDGPQVQPSC